MGHLLILNWSWLRRQWWDGLALPTMASQRVHSCAPWVCRPWVLRAVCLNQLPLSQPITAHRYTHSPTLRDVAGEQQLFFFFLKPKVLLLVPFPWSLYVFDSLIHCLCFFVCLFVFFLHLWTQQTFQRISLSSGPPRPQWSLHGSFLKAGLHTNARWVECRAKKYFNSQQSTV